MTTKTLVDRWIFIDEDGASNGTKITLRVVRSSVPAERGLHDRSNRVHTAALETMKRALNANLQAMSQAQSWASDSGVAAPTVDPIELPASSSPYAVRLAYLSGSLLNASASQQKYAEFDRHVDNWELDLGANDVARFEEKVRTMVTGVVAAMIGRETDTRFDVLNEIGIDVAVQMGIINPLTNVYGDKGIETRENRFVSILNPATERRFPLFLDQTYDEEKKQYKTAAMQALVKVQSARESRKRDLLISDRAFRLSQKIEYDFETAVWNAFRTKWKDRKFETLVKYEFEQPLEGEEYPIQEVSSVGGIPTSESFSLGNGISVVVEAAEIARTYLETLEYPLETALDDIVETQQSSPKRRRIPTTYTRMRADTEYRRRDGSRKPKALTTHRQSATPRVNYTLSELQKLKKEGNEDLYHYFMDSGVVINEDNPKDDTFSGFTRRDVEVQAQELGEWLALNFRGYCYQRQHTLERPLFARLIDCTSENNEITRLNNAAEAAGFINLASSAKPTTTKPAETQTAKPTTNEREIGRYHYYRALRAAGGSDQTGRRVRRLGRYYVVSLCPVSKFSTRSYMRYGEWWGTKSEHTNIESEAFQILRLRAEQLPLDFKGRVPQAINDGAKSFEDLFIFGDHNQAKYFASRLLLLVETTQAHSELYRDAGTRNRTQIAREDVKAAQDAAAKAVLTFV